MLQPSDNFACPLLQLFQLYRVLFVMQQSELRTVFQMWLQHRFK